jgi:hypothetical protein
MSLVQAPDGKAMLFDLAKGLFSDAASCVQEPARLLVVQERK